MVAMIWAAATVIAVLGIGLPVAGWWVTTRRPAPLKAAQRAHGEIDRYLSGQFGLSWRDRERVRAAVLAGKPVSDPALEVAARELAARVLARRFRVLRVNQVVGRVGLASAVAYLAFVLAMLILARGQGAQTLGALGAINAAVLALNGWHQGFHAPRNLRRNAERVLRSSHDHAVPGQ
jgi:hypothetical protein